MKPEQRNIVQTVDTVGTPCQINRPVVPRETDPRQRQRELHEHQSEAQCDDGEIISRQAQRHRPDQCADERDHQDDERYADERRQVQAVRRERRHKSDEV